MDVLAMPSITEPPTGPMCRALRRMLTEDVKAIRNGPARVLCLIGGHEVDKRIVTGALTRGLIRETADEADEGDDYTVYTLTAEGKRWAKTGGE